MSEMIVIDTASFDAVTATRTELITEFNRINEEYERIVQDLLVNWQGFGAHAFRRDADRVRTNIGGIYDILKIMCDTLTDCREVIGIVDSQIGAVNADPFSGCE